MSRYTEINAHTVLRLTQEPCTRTNVIAVRRKNIFCNLRLTFGVWPTWKEAWENILHYLLWDNFRHKISKGSREFSRLPVLTPPLHLPAKPSGTWSDHRDSGSLADTTFLWCVMIKACWPHSCSSFCTCFDFFLVTRGYMFTHEHNGGVLFSTT